jgi:phage gpG-like protein
MSDIEMEVRGLEEVQRKAEQMIQDMRGGRMLNAMRRATLLVQGGARRNLKPWKGPGTGGADTGRMRADITPQIITRTTEILGVIGSKVLYAPFQELGTRPHFVPAKYIGRWAERHGLGFRGVFVSGKALRFLQRAFEDNLKRIRALFETTVRDIVRK